MTALSKTALKALFETGDTITQTTMANLIDSYIDIVDTSAQSVASPLILNGDVTFNANATFTSAISFGSPLGVGSGGTGLANISAYAILVGNNTATPALVSPSSTSGVPLISQGVSANPVYGTVAVAGGGTGQTAYTDGQLLIGNTVTGGLSKATLTAGTNVSIGNGNGTITITAATGGAAGILLQTVTVSTSANSVIYDNTKVTNTYDNYKIVCYGLSASGNTDLLLDMAVSGTYGTLSWTQGSITNSGGTPSYVTGGVTVPIITKSGGSFLTTNPVTRSWIDLAGVTTNLQPSGHSNSGASTNQIIVDFIASQTATINGIKLYPASGFFTAGTFKLYGIL